MHRLFTACILLLSTAALADITLVNEVIAQGKTRTVTLSTKGTKAYFEVKEADGPTRTMLRDGEAKKLFIIDHAKKLVMVITEEDSKKIEEKQAEFRAQMQAQLSKMTPEQRARVESTMLSSADGKAPVYTYEKKKTPARKLAGFACQDYAIKRDGQPAGEACFANWKDVGITAAEFKATMLKAIPTGSSPMAQAFDTNDAPGIPTWRSHVNAAGEVTTETTLKSISKNALPGENFELPKDYPQKSMANSMGR